jgi:hypothetical protein
LQAEATRGEAEHEGHIFVDGPRLRNRVYRAPPVPSWCALCDQGVAEGCARVQNGPAFAPGRDEPGVAQRDQVV